MRGNKSVRILTDSIQNVQQPSASKTVQSDTADTDALTTTQSEVASLPSEIYNREQSDKASSCLYI